MKIKPIKTKWTGKYKSAVAKEKKLPRIKYPTMYKPKYTPKKPKRKS